MSRRTAQPGLNKELMETAMTYSMIDRFAPALILFLGFVASVATAGVGF